MTQEEFVEGVLHGGDHRIGATLLRAQLTLASYLHKVGLEAYLLPYNLGVRKRYRLPVPVIAIGNLTSGGTGKTPMTVLVAGALQRAGKRVVVLSRGHGGSESGSVPRIVSDGEKILLAPAEAGDEPVLLAKRLPGIPVIVCRDRRRSGKLAVEQFAPDVIVCDDALQYWQLHRDLDIVLLDARRPFDNGYILPRGLLREPPAHLARAGIVVLTRTDRLTREQRAERLAEVRRYTDAPLFTAVHAPLGWVHSLDHQELPLATLSAKSAIAFSGIADGSAFAETVRRQNIDLVETISYGDHHRYTREEVAVMSAPRNADIVVVTTEKDLVKVEPLWPADGPPLFALRIGMKIEDESGFLDTVQASVPGTDNRA